MLACSLSYDASLAVGLLTRVGSPQEVFARAFAQCRVGQEREAASGLRSLDSTVLQQLLQAHHRCWLGLDGLSSFGQLLLSVSGFSVLEAVWQQRHHVLPSRACNLLGGASSPLFLAFLEQLLDERPSAETLQLLLQGYLGRCAATLEGVPAEWTAMVDSFTNMRLFDPAEAPLEIRWTLRHWRWRATQRSDWLDSLPPLSAASGAAVLRAHFYTVKMQALLLQLRRLGPETARELGALLESSSSMRAEWLSWCRLLWLPTIGKLGEGLNIACEHLAPEAAAGYCGEFCSAPADWKQALLYAKNKSQLQMLLLAMSAERFTMRELVCEVLPEDETVAAQLALISKAQKLTLLPTILDYARN